MAESYESVQELHRSLPPFTPHISASLLPYLAFVLLMGTFTLTFYFSTLSKTTIPLREIGVASVASILTGFGVVTLFCSVGVNV